MSVIYAVILAGGEGTRFAPLSTPEKPKQFLPILNPNRTMIQETYDRVRSWVPPENILISTNRRYVPLVCAQLPVGPAQVVGEPIKKNTAPPIALITRMIAERNADAVILFLPADHFIADADQARRCWREGEQLASSLPVLVTFGVPPTFPSSEYGYIRAGSASSPQTAKNIEAFVEKPTFERAREYLASGRYYWNSGMFVWRASVFLNILRQAMPALEKSLQSIAWSGLGMPSPAWIENFFKQAPNISIDYGVMEKTPDIGMVPMNAGWSDVGTWQGLAKLIKEFPLPLPPEIQHHLKELALI